MKYLILFALLLSTTLVYSPAKALTIDEETQKTIEHKFTKTSFVTSSKIYAIEGDVKYPRAMILISETGGTNNYFYRSPSEDYYNQIAMTAEDAREFKSLIISNSISQKCPLVVKVDLETGEMLKVTKTCP